LHWIFWKVKRNSKENGYSVGYFQSGLSNEELYSKVSQLIVSNISRVIGIGETISAFKDKFVNCITFNNTAEFISNFESIDFRNHFDKGARSFQFEEIVYLLEEKTHETVLEINLNAISYNFFKSKLKPNVKIMVMVRHLVMGMEAGDC
jgi:alanine racemase